jgi:hypothetical protein
MAPTARAGVALSNRERPVTSARSRVGSTTQPFEPGLAVRLQARARLPKGRALAAGAHPAASALFCPRGSALRSTHATAGRYPPRAGRIDRRPAAEPRPDAAVRWCRATNEEVLLGLEALGPMNRPPTLAASRCCCWSSPDGTGPAYTDPSSGERESMAPVGQRGERRSDMAATREVVTGPGVPTGIGP